MTKRKYKGEDEAMLVRAEVIAKCLANDLDAFGAQFPFFNPDFVATLLTSIDAANDFPLDAEVVNKNRVYTSDVNRKVQEGYEALRELGIYATLTYNNESARQTVFGQNTWAAARSDHEAMITALETAHHKASESSYHDDLLAKGYTDVKIATLLTIADDIRSLFLIQDSARNERSVITQDRVRIYNSVWAILKSINIAAKMIFAKNPAKFQQYLLYA